jgi:hypothetical protein
MSPVSLKSSIDVSSVMLAALCSPRAARAARALASNVPPMQNPSVLALSASVMASAASIAASTPCSR